MTTYRKNRSTISQPRNRPCQIIVPEPEKVMNDARPECAGCPYPRHGMSCQNRDGSCLRDEMNAVNQRSRYKNKKPAFVWKGDRNG